MVNESVLSSIKDLSDLTWLLKDFVKSNEVSSIFVLVDKNTEKYCLPKIEKYFPGSIESNVFVIFPGEHLKSIETVMDFLFSMLLREANRKSLIINLGGGVVSDIGGFAASVFKRGVLYINIPTTLLAMIDASIGGKTGVNFKGIKNQIGTFHFPELVYVNPVFLKTLPKSEWLSGIGEILKYSMIGADINIEDIEKINITKPEISLSVINRCIDFKERMIREDPKEKSKRKILNFGHTIGHAIESAAPELNITVTHGEAVAAGVVAELFISEKINKINSAILKDVLDLYNRCFPEIPYSKEFENRVCTYIRHDKKNEKPGVSCILLNEKLKPVIHQKVEMFIIREALQYVFPKLKSI